MLTKGDAKMIDPSHLGFLDPVHTPEGSKTGVTLHLPLGAKKKANTVAVKMFNIKTGKMEDVDPKKAYKSNVVLPDQVTWVDGKPKPIGKTVKFSGEGNEIEEGSISNADYVMAAPAQLFSVASNMVPFIQNNSGNRATYADRQM
jgi:DNA-directed RNA polymerase beta subunit